MKETLLQYLACPACAGDLSLESAETDNGEIASGALRCTKCQKSFAVREGVPRFADLANDEVQRETAENFGEQWLEFDHVADHHEKQFLDWIAPDLRRWSSN